MSSYNPNNQLWSDNQNQNRGFFSRVLRDLSNWGMSYSDMVSKNKVTVGINEDPTQMTNSGDWYNFFSQRAISSVLAQKSIAYLDKSINDKIRILREYSIKDEIRDFITTISDEAIIYNDEERFCRPRKLSENYSQEVRDRYYEIFEEVYYNFGFANGKRAWDIFRKFIIDGFVAYEIVWDDKAQKIIGYEEIDPVTIMPGYEPETGSHIWIQYPEDPQLRKVILDSQIIYLSYKSHTEYSETSYVEGLIRPYNQLKIIEQSRIIFNMANATVYQKYVIPIKDLPRHRAEESVGKMIANYSEEVSWDDTMGTPEINGSKHIPYNKQLWFPEGESGTPQFELISPEGHNLNENDMLTWFYNALKRASNIPFSRFDKDNGGGSMYNDSTEMTRDEVKFGNFVKRLRTSFKEIILKPIKLQLLNEFPEFREDPKFINSINVDFNTNDLFEEWKKINNISKRADIVANLSTAFEINGRQYFHPDYLAEKYLKLTEEEKQLNENLWKTKPMQGEGSEGESDFGGGEGFGGGDDDFTGGGDEDFGGEDDDLGGGDTNTDTDTGGDEGDFDF